MFTTKKCASFLTVRKYSRVCLVIIALLILARVLEIYLPNFSAPSVNEKNDINNGYSLLKRKPAILHDDLTTRNLSIHDVLLIIRTSKTTQQHRMPAILKTWFHFSPNTTYITTNDQLIFLHKQLPQYHHHQIYQSDCQQAHSIRDLCCHSASEFRIYFEHEHRFKWLCRFDDDQYVNVPLLIDYLGRFQSDKQPMYIGKPSMKEPKRGHGIQFWFATYGGGVCFSRLLLETIRQEIQPNDKFIQGCITSNYPDDTHIAYLLRTKFNINLTVAEDFHHHIEGDLFTNRTNASTIDRAITLGFKGSNVPRFVPLFKQDTYHMQTLHCLLYPNAECMRLVRILLNQLYEQQKH